jgi:hypothetical protein
MAYEAIRKPVSFLSRYKFIDASQWDFGAYAPFIRTVDKYGSEVMSPTVYLSKLSYLNLTNSATKRGL